MKFFTTLYLLALFTFKTLAQDKPKEWTTYQKTDEVLIEYLFKDCDPIAGPDQEAVYFRFTNLKEEVIFVKWHTDIYRNGICKSCDESEYSFTLKLNPNESKEGCCDPTKCEASLRIFSMFLNENLRREDQSLEKFELSNINVKCKSCK